MCFRNFTIFLNMQKEKEKKKHISVLNNFLIFFFYGGKIYIQLKQQIKFCFLVFRRVCSTKENNSFRVPKNIRNIQKL